MSIPNTEKLLRYLLDCQEESGRWILPSETGEEMYTWYTYVTAFALGSIPSNKQSELSKSLRSSILTESTKDRIFAIVIGINQYNDEQVKPLKCAENDEEAICKWLQMVPPKRLKLYRLSTRIPNNIPTRSAILGAIGKVSRQIEDHSQSILIFFFSGHGKRFGLKDYLLPSDFTFDAPEDTALALDDIISKIRTIKPYRSVLFIDACRDETSKGLGLQLQKLFTAYNLPSQGCITTILSCSGGENSFELPEGDYFGFKGLGAFTLALLKSVSGLPTQSKVISLKMILDRLPKELEQLNRKYGKDIQRPQINVENTIMLENTFLPMLDTNL
jgi:hypothetical protein